MLQSMTGKFTGPRFGLALGVVVLLDLWSVERRFIRFSPPAHDSFAADQVVRTLEQDSSLFRLLPANTYQGLENYFMVHRLRSVLGYHANEPHRYDELLGGKNEWRNLGTPNILKLLTVKYVVLGKQVDTPLLSPVGSGPLTTLDNQPVYLYRLHDAEEYGFLVAEALQLSDSQTIAVLLNPQFDPRRLIIVPPEAHVGVNRLSALPPVVDTRVAIRQTRPGAYRADFAAPTTAPAYLFVSENYDPAWGALVDGKPATVVRAQYALMAVPVPAGTRSVELSFASRGYRLGLAVTLAALLGLLAVFLDDRMRRSRASRPSGIPAVA
jgi:hypothetical protein